MSDSTKNNQQVAMRSLEASSGVMPILGPLANLPGLWQNSGDFIGHGWNMIALPFPSGEHDYRLLNNQYNETLTFNLVDKHVPNRGMEGDQKIFTLDYVQAINQIIAEDSPDSGLAGEPNLAIHHEPGLWLHMKNHTIDQLDIARLSSIPHGDTLLALGHSQQSDQPFPIHDTSGLPIGVSQDLQNNAYLKPYLHFHKNKFRGVFDPTLPNELLKAVIQPFIAQKNIASVTQLTVDSTLNSGGVHNIPFVVKQANVANVSATFWIYELTDKHPNGESKMLLQYTQTVMLEFFKREDGKGFIQWPHVSINTLEKAPSPS